MPSSDAFAHRPDFDNDGFAELAVGTPWDNVLDINNAGVVNVLYGSPTGPTAAGDDYWTQDSPGILDTAESGDFFSDALGWSDFNGDGFDDLAVGVPWETVRGQEGAGAVNVLYGSASGLLAVGDDYWTQATPGLPDEPEASDHFGNALVGRDFNGDGFGDRAIGVRGESPPAGAGVVQVLYGSADGLTADGDQLWNPPQGQPTLNDNFGGKVTAGDFDSDGFADLVVGTPGKVVSGVRAGSVSLLYGSASGLTVDRNQFWHQNRLGVVDDAEGGDQFGRSVSAADLDGDGYDDLAVGVPSEDVGVILDAGAAHVFYGSQLGLAAARNQLWHQDTPGVLDAAEENDTVGDLLAGDFDGDGFADLVMTYTFEDLGGVLDAGGVGVLYGTAGGLDATGNQLWTQDSAGIAGSSEALDEFGVAVSRADYDDDNFADLVVSVRAENVGAVVDAGAVHVLFGSLAGVSADRSQYWTQDSPGVQGAAGTNDWFGLDFAER